MINNLMKQLEDGEIIYYDDEIDEFVVTGNCSIIFSGKTIKSIVETYDHEVLMVSVDDWYIDHMIFSLLPTDFTITKDGEPFVLR